jgi:hypothetical protein
MINSEWPPCRRCSMVVRRSPTKVRLHIRIYYWFGFWLLTWWGTRTVLFQWGAALNSVISPKLLKSVKLLNQRCNSKRSYTVGNFLPTGLSVFIMISCKEMGNFRIFNANMDLYLANLVPRACDPREGTWGSGIIRFRDESDWPLKWNAQFNYSSILARIPGFRQRIIPEPHVPSRGSQARGTRLVFSLFRNW